LCGSGAAAGPGTVLLQAGDNARSLRSPASIYRAPGAGGLEYLYAVSPARPRASTMRYPRMHTRSTSATALHVAATPVVKSFCRFRGGLLLRRLLLRDAVE